MSARLKGAALLLVAAAGAWWFLRADPDSQGLPAGALHRYNVLLVTIDTLRADRVGAYGSTAGLTPTLDRLAAEGVRFDSARSNVPLTLPSHASLLTGQIPPRHGVRDNGTYRLDVSHPTIATALKAAGYRTAAFVGAFVLDARFGLARGFDEYDDRYGERPAAGRTDVIERPADKVTAPAMAWIQTSSEPWFAWAHLYDPHEPYAPPEPFASRYPDAPYDGEVAYVDSALGRMLDVLGKAGRLHRTLVVITSDHGESLGEHGERTHGLFAYESTLHVPLIVWCPSRIKSSVDRAPLGLADVATQILNVVGVSWPGGSDSSASSGRPTYFEALNANLTRNWAPLTGIVSNGMKLIDLPVPELYDLRADPGETQNQYARRPDVARRLERMLDATAGSRAAPAGSAVDAETSARLRSLGYVVSQASTKLRRFTADDDPKNLVALDAALDEAMKVAGRGEHAAAVAMLEDVIRRRPDLPVAYDRLAFVLHSSGRLTDAIALLEQAASKGVADAPVLVSLGTMLQEAGQIERSASVLEAAVGMNAQDLEARSRLGTTYARMGRAADAERAFRAVLDADPRSPEALTNLGVLYLGTGRREEAIATLREAIEADPALAGARNTLAVAYAQSGDLERAAEEWQQVLTLRPDDPDVLYNMGTALLKLNRPAEAVPILERFIAAAPPRYAKDVARVRRMIVGHR